MAGETECNLHLVLATIPLYGHTRAIKAIAEELSPRGYRMTCIVGSAFRHSFDRIQGVDVVTLTGAANYDPQVSEASFPDRQKTEQATVERLYHDVEGFFYAGLDDMFNALQTVLLELIAQRKRVILIQDMGFMGSLPSFLGAHGAIRVPTIAVGCMPVMWRRVRAAPFGSGLPDQGEERNNELYDQWIKIWDSIQRSLENHLVKYRCARPLQSNWPYDHFSREADIFCQLSIPDLEEDKGDMPPHLRYAGPVKGQNASHHPVPDWFASFVTENDSDRPLVLVTAGTILTDLSNFVIPAIEACEPMHVRLLICSGTPKPADLHLQDHMRWAAWIPFEDILPYAALMVSNGGYNGINQAFAHGVPMVVAGLSEDKTETTARAGRTGAAINLATQVPSANQLRGAIQRVLKERSYKDAAEKLRKTYLEYSVVDTIIESIKELEMQ